MYKSYSRQHVITLSKILTHVNLYKKDAYFLAYTFDFFCLFWLQKVYFMLINFLVRTLQCKVEKLEKVLILPWKHEKPNFKYRYTLAKFQNSSIAQKGPTYPETKKYKFIALGISNFYFDLTLV